MQSNPSPSQYVFIFVRQDISIPQQLVQSNHATISMTSLQPVEGTPNLVLIGVPDVHALELVSGELSFHDIDHYCWHEPDWDMGFTAICTQPMTKEQKEFLSGYRTWKPIFPGSLEIKAACSNQEDRGFKSLPGNHMPC